MIDMSENRVSYGLLTTKERASLPTTGFILIYCDNEWIRCTCSGYYNDRVYRTIKEPVRKSSTIGFHCDGHNHIEDDWLRYRIHHDSL
jgi:hypothetical protein